MYLYFYVNEFCELHVSACSVYLKPAFRFANFRAVNLRLFVKIAGNKIFRLAVRIFWT